MNKDLQIKMQELNEERLRIRILRRIPIFLIAIPFVGFFISSLGIVPGVETLINIAFFIPFIGIPIFLFIFQPKIKEFENGEIDILVATTIIENGIDIENANTMIIDRADKLGLSQIYQLRGRVGRGNRQSYCYLLTKEYQTKKAKEREESIKNLEEIDGGGLQLSMEDMRIRGAGEILGEKQHGILETFGYTLYMKMLQEEIDKIKGRFEEDIDDIEIKVNYPAFIPNEYIEKDEKIKVYRRITEVKSIIELENIKDELIDRFGKMPVEAQGFFRYIGLKFRAKKLGIKNALEIKGKVESIIKFNSDKVNFDVLLKLIQEGLIKYQKKDDTIEYNGTIEEFLNVYEQ